MNFLINFFLNVTRNQMYQIFLIDSKKYIQESVNHKLLSDTHMIFYRKRKYLKFFFFNKNLKGRS